MPLAARLPLLPPKARVISDNLAILEDDEFLVYFNAAGPIYSCRREDEFGVRLGAVTVLRQGLAKVAPLARACSVHRATLFRDLKKFEEGGVEGLRPKPLGPRGPHKFTGLRLRRAQKLLDAGTSLAATAERVGVSRRGVIHAIGRGLLTRPSSPASPVGREEGDGAALPGPSARAAEDRACEVGVGVRRTVDRVLACQGKIPEALPEFEAAESVSGAGVLLALPALLQQGLLDVGLKVYGQLRHGFFGLRSILLTFAFMALLRIRTPEQLTEKAPGELGRLIGLDRAPEVKTLRRKLEELGERDQAHAFTRELAEAWVAREASELGILYVDGHVRPYHGHAHSLPKLHVQQRGRAMPGTKDFHVNDRRADPLFFVTAEATEGILDQMDRRLLPEIRRLVGSDRRVTIVFDREGWSPKLFRKWKEEKFDVLTYRKGKQTRWQERFFETREGRVGGEKVSYQLAARRVKLSHGLVVREIRRLTDDGHQTAVITTDERMTDLAAAHRVFSRWRQENFFRYMRHEYALDHLCTTDVEPADPKRLITPPKRAAAVERKRAARAARARLLDLRRSTPPGTRVRVGRRTLDREGLDAEIRKRDAEIDRLDKVLAALPKKVPIDTILAPAKIVRLERERKVLVDAIKLAAYRAESTLARLVDPFFARHEDEARKFLKTIFQAPADLLPDEHDRRLTVRFHGLSSPRATRALAALCDVVNQQVVPFPGTDLRLHFEAPASQR